MKDNSKLCGIISGSVDVAKLRGNIDARQERATLKSSFLQNTILIALKKESLKL